jgi:hypothetical protein
MADHYGKFWDRKLARRLDAGFAQREWGVAAGRRTSSSATGLLSPKNGVAINSL